MCLSIISSCQSASMCTEPATYRLDLACFNFFCPFFSVKEPFSGQRLVRQCRLGDSDAAQRRQVVGVQPRVRPLGKPRGRLLEKQRSAGCDEGSAAATGATSDRVRVVRGRRRGQRQHLHRRPLPIGSCGCPDVGLYAPGTTRCHQQRNKVGNKGSLRNDHEHDLKSFLCFSGLFRKKR